MFDLAFHKIIKFIVYPINGKNRMLFIASGLNTKTYKVIHNKQSTHLQNVIVNKNNIEDVYRTYTTIYIEYFKDCNIFMKLI
jgi:hypothetical protein